MPEEFDPFSNEEIETPDCTCDTCIAERRARTSRAENRDWATNLLRLPMYVVVVNELDASAYATYTMRAVGDLPVSYMLFTIPFSMGARARTLIPLTAVNGAIYGIASYGSPIEQYVKKVGDVWTLDIPEPATCDVCHTPVRVPDLMGKYKVHRQCAHSSGYGSGNTRWERPARSFKKEPPSFSVEFEMYIPGRDDAYNEMLVELIQHRFQRTSDSTVSDEMVSPIYASDRTFLAALPVMEKAANAGYVSDRCGTHIHTGITDYPRDFYQGHYSDFFGELGNYLDWSNLTEKIWGRCPNEWARSYYHGRYSWLNFETGFDTIEYRLPRFISATQYRMLVSFCRTFTVQLRTLYNDHYRRIPRKDRWSYGEGEVYLLNYYKRFEQFAIKHLPVRSH